ncbi:DegV family protein [Fredinandcohnia sp. QZ13]|uniref:DegV family protein n=1 Tax=Fredinandcohnia sp. QZ13 TaxID=3073144 RepID=UPI002853237C|nr:DegV family protein [Fredinandcohnia sp. QZ13]MDR4888620.1 DegV family protein [Fredinandcohnia sp. QZ13]
MGKIAWVTDSTAFLDEELSNHKDIYVIPMTIFFDEEEYLDGVTITPTQFFERLKTAKTIPKTSQPSIGSFVELYNSLEDKYDEIISVHISEKLSGTVSSARQAAELVNIPVTVIDSKILTYPMTKLIKEGMKLIQNGGTSAEVEKLIVNLAQKLETYVIIGSLEQLHRSGRMNTAQYFLGSMLQIKPVIQIMDGALSVKEKVRSENKATSKIVGYLKDAVERDQLDEIYILYGLDNSKTKEWKEMIREFAPDHISIEAYPLGVAIGVHAGENTIGISWMNK